MEEYFLILKSLNESLVQNITIGIPTLLKHYLLIKFEIIVVTLILYTLVKFGRNICYDVYYKFKYLLVRKPRILIGIYRLYFGINGLLEFIMYRILRVITGPDYEKDLAHYIFEDSLLSKMKRMLIDLFKPTEITNLISAGLAVYIHYNLTVSDLAPRYIDFVRNGKPLFISLLTYLPALVIILGVFVGWRYTSLKGRYVRGANRLNQNRIEETLDIHRKLLKLMIKIIDKGAKNVEHILECRNLLVENRIKEISPLIKEIQDEKILWNDSLYHVENTKPHNIDLDTIEEINCLVEILEEAKERNLMDELFWIRLYSGKMRALREFIFKSPKDLKRYLKRELLTPDHINEIFKKDTDEIYYKEIKSSLPDEKERLFIEKEILEDIRGFEQMIDDKIVDTIEMLVDFSYYHKEAYKLLHFNSNKFGRLLGMITGRD